VAAHSRKMIVPGTIPKRKPDDAVSGKTGMASISAIISMISLLSFLYHTTHTNTHIKAT
jgi:hypothetical protein